ncbi:MAG: hypothetical protein KAS66_05610 [Candidatus Omnitrophica bacterium]|nr:hypothetical protein [Candidatus Omnitrophota bacterium]
MKKKIGNIKSCNRCPLRIYREVICEDNIKYKSFCVGNKEPYHPEYSYFIRIHNTLITDLELTDLSIIHPDCPLEDD